MKNSIIYKNSTVAYSDTGKGNAIVLLHGFLENSTMWDEISNELSKTNRVVCIDLLGHGETDCIGYVHTMNDMAEAVNGVLRHLKLRRFYMIGHSMGGYVSLVYAEKYLKKVKGICLLNSTAQSDSDERKVLRLRACKMAQTNYINLIKLSVSNLFTNKTRTEFALEVAKIKKEALKMSLQGYIAATKGMMVRGNKENVLQMIDKRLIISGKNDPLLKSQLILEEATRTKTPVVWLPDGHMSHIENRNEVIVSLKKFIKR